MLYTACWLNFFIVYSIYTYLSPYTLHHFGFSSVSTSRDWAVQRKQRKASNRMSWVFWDFADANSVRKSCRNWPQNGWRPVMCRSTPSRIRRARRISSRGCPLRTAPSLWSGSPGRPLLCLSSPLTCLITRILCVTNCFWNKCVGVNKIFQILSISEKLLVSASPII